MQKNEKGGDLHENMAGDGKKEKQIGNMGCRVRQLVVEIGDVNVVGRLDKGKSPGFFCCTLTAGCMPGYSWWRVATVASAERETELV
jgi:hypothetical protein